MSNRHRRTRIYGANYDIGESYYKKQLNDLDSKREINRNNNLSLEIDTKKEGKFSPKVTFLSEDMDFNDKNSDIIKKFNFNNNDDEGHITHERPIYKRDQLDEEYINSSPKITRKSFIDIDRYHKSLENYSSRLLKKDDVEEQKAPVHLDEKMTLRSKFMCNESIRKESNIEEVDASRRASISKARLLDLEEQIMSVTNKQNEREKRNRNLKKILSDVSSKQELILKFN